MSVRLDSSFRLPVADAHAIEWWASDDQESRHAFRPVDGFRWSLCGQARFTAAFGHHGNGTCLACLAALKEQIRSASAAVAAAEAEDLAAGDHYAGMSS